MASGDRTLNTVSECACAVFKRQYGKADLPVLQPAMYGLLIKPWQNRIFDFISSETDAEVFYHFCRAMFDVSEDLIDIGVDILSRIGLRSAGMDIADMKQEIDQFLFFWGCRIDIQMVEPPSPRDIGALTPSSGNVGGAYWGEPSLRHGHGLEIHFPAGFSQIRW